MQENKKDISQSVRDAAQAVTVLGQATAAAGQATAAAAAWLEEHTDNAVELLQGLTVEQMRALYFDASALIEPPYKLYQVNARGTRYYYRYDESGNAEFFPSVTTVLGATVPMEPHLIKWIANKGYDEAERFKGERAAYGTFMHAQFAELLINRRYDLDALIGRLSAYIEREGLPADFILNAEELKRDILSFAQFVIDYDVRPLAVEVALCHPEAGIAGMIDCVCRMRERIGSDTYITAIVDFKSGRKGFYKEHELQLHMYRDMWIRNFDVPIDRVYNFAPKEWRKGPTYHLKDQTRSPYAAMIPHLIAIYAIDAKRLNPLYANISGVVDLSDADALSSLYEFLPLAELIERRRFAAAAEDAPDADAVADAIAAENAGYM